MRSPVSLLRRSLGTIGVLTVSLWLFALLLWTAQDLLAGEAFPSEYKWLLIQTFAIGSVFSLLLAGLILATHRWPRLVRTVLVAAAALALAVLHGWIDALLLHAFRLEIGSTPPAVARMFIAGLMPFVLIYGFYAVTLGLVLSSMKVRDSERRLAEAQMAAQRAQLAAQQAQLAALRFQLNPHFLFNTLNAISSLIVTHRNGQAERMMMQLAEFMRATLETDPADQVTLAEELSLTQSYLDIEAERVGDRLDVTIDCPPALRDALVPNFVLQPFVENSIKYAVAPSRRPVTIAIGATTDGDLLQLTIVDSGRDLQAALPPGGSGVGIDTVRKRLAALYGDTARVETDATSWGFRASLFLPLTFAAATLAAE